MSRQNPRTRDITARALAIELLVSVRKCPHINREELFEVALAYYRWELAHDEEMDLWAAYMDEFLYQHGSLLQQIGAALEAAFATWFVANGFHRLPVFKKEDTLGLHGERLHFSLPCFPLPTSGPDHTFLSQWLNWVNRHRDEPPPGDTLLYRWSREMARHLPQDCGLNRDALVEQCCSFLSWCCTADYDPELLLAYMVQFANEHDGPLALFDVPELWEAHFFTWFTGRVLSRLDLENAS